MSSEPEGRIIHFGVLWSNICYWPYIKQQILKTDAQQTIKWLWCEDWWQSPHHATNQKTDLQNMQIWLEQKSVILVTDGIQVLHVL